MSYNYTINIGKTVINVTQNPLDDILSANNLIHNMMTGYLMFSHKRIKQATTITSLHSSQQQFISQYNDFKQKRPDYSFIPFDYSDD
jgi:hypothetical protein